tara:strand:+ start:358 stop:474 length:117 start_codon:yes stop_codon:yes gene_type:complete
MNLKEMPDSEFQNLIEALPSYDWDYKDKDYLLFNTGTD